MLFKETNTDSISKQQRSLVTVVKEGRAVDNTRASGKQRGDKAGGCMSALHTASAFGPGGARSGVEEK